MICLAQKPEYIDYANAILGVNFDKKMAVSIASLGEDGDILGVVVYSRFTKWNCELSVASTSKKFINKAFLRAVFTYPFVQCGLRRVTAVVEDGNISALDMDLRLGFVRETDLKGWYGDTDGIMLRMMKEECKWL